MRKQVIEQKAYDLDKVNFPLELPLPPEPYGAAWEAYHKRSKKVGAWTVLRDKLVQFSFPIRENISKEDDYRAATLRGANVKQLSLATGLTLQEPAALQIQIYQSMAGPIPALITSNRSDFVTLIQALAHRNEPASVPPSMGAYMLSGYNNWDRVRAYRARWAENRPDGDSEWAWKFEFKKLIPQKHLYQDRLMILSNGPYSDIPAAQLGLSEEEWAQLSLRIRQAHEGVHYFTKRLFGELHNNIFDEILADYVGIVSAAGAYRADWFLRFMGLEDYPGYRQGGRLENYLTDSSPQASSFQAVQTQLKAAVENLKSFDVEKGAELRDTESQALLILALAQFTLSELATPEAPKQLGQSLEKLRLKQKED